MTQQSPATTRSARLTTQDSQLKTQNSEKQPSYVEQPTNVAAPMDLGGPRAAPSAPAPSLVTAAHGPSPAHVLPFRHTSPEWRGGGGGDHQNHRPESRHRPPTTDN